MTSLNPSIRLKVKRDTFYLPEPNRGVYFRNNVSSFRMEGSMIEQWVEKLLPMFNGENTLGKLTAGLPGPYRDRVYEIAEVLYQNGFVRDVSGDHSHQLSEKIVKKHASQIEFLDSLAGSGAYRFQVYRESRVLAIGSGPFFVSLISSLIESGLPKIHVLIPGTVPTNKRRLLDLAAHARKTDSEVAIEEVTLKKAGERSLREIIQAFDSILYVSNEGSIKDLRYLHKLCREEKKVFIPAIFLKNVGLAGPIVHPDSEGCWESAWRRLHQSALVKKEPFQGFSSTAGSMLANVIVFELLKKQTGVTEQEKISEFYLLDLETMEGNWHSFLPHPLVTGEAIAEWVDKRDWQIDEYSRKGESSELLHFFYQLTSRESGIFHIWEEGALKQLPLAQCRVQAVDPLSQGPAELLQDKVCTGMTHEEARREAGLTGIESYAARLVDLLLPTLEVGIGAGETFAESVCRGLKRCLEEELRKQQLTKKPTVSRVHLNALEDERCRFYLQALTTMRREPIIGIGEAVAGFPVVWIRTRDGWYGSVDLNITAALRRALQQALSSAQNDSADFTEETLVTPVLLEKGNTQSLVIPSDDERSHAANLKNALEVLERNHKQLQVLELKMEPFLKEKLAGVFGVLLQEVESG